MVICVMDENGISPALGIRIGVWHWLMKEASWGCFIFFTRSLSCRNTINGNENPCL